MKKLKINHDLFKSGSNSTKICRVCNCLYGREDLGSEIITKVNNHPNKSTYNHQLSKASSFGNLALD